MDLQDAPENIAKRECIHERIQAELRNGDIEKVSQAEEMLELPPVWNEVQDLIMDGGDMISEDLRPEKHSPTEPRRVHPPQGLYAEEWIEDQQEEDDYQKPDKFQKISNMVFLNGVQEVPLVQHQGGGCSI